MGEHNCHRVGVASSILAARIFFDVFPIQYYLFLMEQTVTVKFKLLVDDISPFIEMGNFFCDACDYLSEYVYDNYDEASLPTPVELQKSVYRDIREKFKLKSQMTISVIRTVVARYKSLITMMINSQKEHDWWLKRCIEEEARGSVFRKGEPHVHRWKMIRFQNRQCSLVASRDWSFVQNGSMISINTLRGRIRVPYLDSGFEKYRGSRYGTAQLIVKGRKVFLNVGVTTDVPDCNVSEKTKVVGIDSGIRFMATAYDGEKTVFYSGRTVREKRFHYKEKRRELQKRNTKSSKRRMRLIGKRENRWMNDYLHCLSKTLVDRYPSDTVFALEDLSGVVGSLMQFSTEKRGIYISWPYGKFVEFLKYKAQRRGQMVILVDPYRTSSVCPSCGKMDRGARRYAAHEYVCECGFRSNDDRAAAMNIRKRGLEKLQKIVTATG